MKAPKRYTDCNALYHYIIHEFMAYSLEDFAKREKDQKITKVFFEIYVLKILKIFIKKIVE